MRRIGINWNNRYEEKRQKWQRDKNPRTPRTPVGHLGKSRRGERLNPWTFHATLHATPIIYLYYLLWHSKKNRSQAQFLLCFFLYTETFNKGFSLASSRTLLDYRWRDNPTISRLVICMVDKYSWMSYVSNGVRKYKACYYSPELYVKLYMSKYLLFQFPP